MPPESQFFKVRVAAICCAASTLIAMVELALLPFYPGYLAFAALAGAITGTGWIVILRTEGRVQLGYLGLVAIPLLHTVAKNRCLPRDSASLFQASLFLAVAIALGFGMPIVYREVKKRG